MPKIRPIQVLTAAMALWLSCTFTAQADGRATEPPGHVVVLGKVTNNPEMARRGLGPLAAYVGLHLSDLGIKGIRLFLVESNDEMTAQLRAGKVDWITEAASSASAFVDNAGAEILARRWRRGAPEYQTIIVARRDSNILSLSDLAGRTIAFEDPQSIPAYFVPAHAILQAGLALTPLERPGTTATNSVGYIFSRDEIVTGAWVHEGKVDAGAISNRDWNSEAIMPPAYRADFRVIYTSGKFPYALDLVRASLDPTIKTRIQQALLDAHKTRNGRNALRAYNRTARYDEAPAKVTRSIAELRDIQAAVRSRLP